MQEPKRYDAHGSADGWNGRAGRRSIATARGRSGSGGYTLIECMIALFVFGFVLAGLAYLMLSTINLNTQARRYTAATTLAHAKLEAIRAAGYAAAASSPTPESLNETGGTTGAAFYSRAWTVATATPVANSKTVTVTVTWSDQQGSRNIQLQSIVTP
jgi:prepilin-type N-terminal cleavage/methylation domain-containing protein